MDCRVAPNIILCECLRSVCKLHRVGECNVVYNYQKAKQTHHSDTPLPFNQTENERCLFLSPTRKKVRGALISMQRVVRAMAERWARLKTNRSLSVINRFAFLSLGTRLPGGGLFRLGGGGVALWGDSAVTATGCAMNANAQALLLL